MGREVDCWCRRLLAIIPRTKAMPLIETQDLGKKFGAFQAVEGVALRLEAGQTLALLGPNGAGKTTTIRMLASILRPSSGWARVAGYDVAAQPAQVRRQIGLLTEHHGLYTRMRAPEYLGFFAGFYGMPEELAARRIGDLLDQFGIRPAIRQRLGTYSKGMRQKLALVRALLHDPSVLLLDEPTSAMDPTGAHLVRASINQMRSQARAIVICTHNLAEAEALADEIAIIRRGQIVARGSPDSLKQAYLGDPVMEIRLAAPLDGALAALPPEVHLLERGQDWLRFATPQPRDTNPRLLQAFSQAGYPVVTLAQVPRTLEDVYLKIIEAFDRAQESQ
jgi:ABC-2 type transport system ATP-binding protein